MSGLQLDHLVIAARTLEEGVDWCGTTLGLRPSAGGEHLFMGTHNRVFDVSSASHPRVYLEVIAIAPQLPAPARPRWFDLDDELLQQQLAQRGPQLVAWVARCNGIERAVSALRHAQIDVGEVMDAERMTPHGLLRWRIALRADGRRPGCGGAPVLIEWDARHPTDDMAASGVRLESLQVGAILPETLQPANVGSNPAAEAAPLVAAFATPRGRVTLQAPRVPRVKG